ncbi:hypothetical protein HYC85_030110 [Camellia sinensis]|uniref:Retrotransposon gag domain-containing protein n=1 Tax=Camellia sinensis TaxID=4442 RepID=A0A7J7FZZ3_CAMSI|nr:hypothetical protein HYC85_030110 [Camellia sinensis]
MKGRSWPLTGGNSKQKVAFSPSTNQSTTHVALNPDCSEISKPSISSEPINEFVQLKQEIEEFFRRFKREEIYYNKASTGTLPALLTEYPKYSDPSVAAQIFGPSLERGVCRSSESCVAPVLDLRAVFLGSSELFVVRAVWVFLRSIENFLARARVFCVWSLERPILRSSERDVDWILEFLEVLLEKHLINAVSNRNSSNASGLSLSGNEIRRGRGARRGRPARQEVPLPGEIPAVQEGVGQANVVEPVGQQAMGALAREIAGALGILRAGNQAAETGPSFLKREFFRCNPDEFIGDPKEPLKADEWLEQTTKTFEMLGIEDGALKVTLASFQLKGDAGQWWKYEKARVGGTWEAFVNAFQERFLSAAAREKLRDQFSRLNQQGLSVAEFEATFTSLSRFAPELVASEERRCYEFEQKLRRGLKLRIGGSYIREYRHLVDAAAHMELMMQEEDEGQRGSKRSQDSQGDGRRQKGYNPQQS